MRELLREFGPRAGAGTVAEAAADAEVLVLSTPWNGTREAIESSGNLAGRIVVDCTNPLKADLSGLSVENAFMISGKPLKKRRDRVGSSGIRRMDVVCVTFCCGQKKVERA